MVETLSIYTLQDDGTSIPFPEAGDGQAKISSYTYTAGRMGNTSITATLMYIRCLDKEWNDRQYVEFQGEKYFILSTPTSSKSNTDLRYKHDLNFVSERVQLDNTYFFDVVSPDATDVDQFVSNSTKFSFFGDVVEFAKRLNYSLKYSNLGYTVVVDDGISSEGKLMSFEDKFFSEVLQEVFNVYELPYYFVGKTIHIGFTSNAITHPFKYGHDKELLSITKTNANYKVVNRCTGYGSTENIPHYYPNSTAKGTVLAIAGSTNKGLKQSDIVVANQLLFQETVSLNKKVEFKETQQRIDIPVYLKSVQYYYNRTDKSEHTSISFYEYNGTIRNSQVKSQNYVDVNLPEVYMMQTGTGSSSNTYKLYGRVYLKFDLEADTEVRLDFGCVFKFAIYRGEYGRDSSSHRGNYIKTLVWDIGELPRYSWYAKEVLSGIDSVNESLSTIIWDGNGGITANLSKGHHDILINIESSALNLDHGYIPSRENSYVWDYELSIKQPVETRRKYNTWYYDNQRINLSSLGIDIGSAVPQVGDYFVQQQERGSYIISPGYLMPSIYRETKGAERFYNALNNTYTNPDTGLKYDFENEYTSGNPKEMIVAFDYIKPTIKNVKNNDGLPIGEILDVALDEDDNDEIVEGGTELEHPYFYVKLRKFDGQFGFNLFEQGIATGEMMISMTSGNCAACNFKVAINPDKTNPNIFYNPVQVDASGNIVAGSKDKKIDKSNIQPQQQNTKVNEVWIALEKDQDTFGVAMPNNERSYKPKTGDSFVLINIQLPNEYIYAAENELKEAIIKYMASNNSEKFNFSINFKRIFFAEHPDILAQINENARLQIAYDVDAAGKDRMYELYVSNYTYKAAENAILPEITVELSDTITIRKNGIQNSIDAVKQDIMSSVGSIDFLKMGLKYFIRKDTDDVASGRIVFNKGIYVTAPIENAIQEVEANTIQEVETNAIQEDYIQSRAIVSDGCLVYTTSLPLKSIMEKQTIMIDGTQVAEIENIVSRIESGHVILPTSSDVVLNEGGITGTVKLNAPITFTLNTVNNSLSISVPVAFEGDIFMVNISANSVVANSMWTIKIIKVGSGGGGGAIVVQDTPPEDVTSIWIDTSKSEVGNVNSKDLAPIVEAIQSIQKYLNTIVRQRDLIINPGDVTNTVTSSVLAQYTPVDPNPNATPEEKITLLASAIADEIVPSAADYEPNTKAVRAHYGTMKEIQDNFKNFVDYELILATDRKALYTKINGEPVNLTGSSGGGGGGGSLDYEALDKLDSIGFVSPSGQVYRVKVNNNGQLIVYKKELDVPQAEPTGGQTDAATGWVYVTTLFLEKLYINSLYCGGLTSDEYSYNPCSHNFVELSNLTNNDISLNGLSLQYGTEGGNWEVLPLWGEIKKGSTFLIRGAQCSVMDVNTTRIKVKTFDMEWYASDGNLIKFDNRKAKFFLTWGTDPSSVANPYNNTTTPIRISKGYIDLVGLQVINAGDADKVDAFEAAPYGYLNSKYLFTKYYQMDGVKQATKALSARNNSTLMYFVDLTQNIVPRIESYTPRASFEGKGLFFNKTLLDPDNANKVTMTLGRKGNAPNATRCFNWVSVGYYDEYLQWNKVGDSTSLGLVESFKKETGVRKYYNRIRGITTDGTPFTTHKVILKNLSAGEYEFKILRNDNLMMKIISDTYNFIVLNEDDDLARNFMFIQTSDQQGFNWDEYQMWKIASKEIETVYAASLKTGFCAFMINTGDMTQNGNRINEWLDYEEGRQNINMLPEMVTVGNNDLTPANVYLLGDGGDNSKINPTNISFFYCYEMDEDNPPIFTIEGKEVFVECLYSFDYGGCHFLCVNSEISSNTEQMVYGLQTTGVVYDQIKLWCERDAAKSTAKVKIAYCHEMPFTIITQDLINSFYWDGIEYPAVERSGSRLNFNVSKANAYWFSKFLQTHNYRACLGGHKHTYTCSYPLLENPASSMKPIIQVNAFLLNERFGSAALYEETTGLLKGQKFPERWKNDSNYDMVKHLCTFELVDKITAPTYIMCQATGYKHTSNKELPSPNIPWLRYFFPASITIKSRTDITAKVNAGQRYPFYIEHTIRPEIADGTVKLSSIVKKVSGAFDNAGKYNVNIQGTDPNVTSIPGNGEYNNGGDMINVIW